MPIAIANPTLVPRRAAVRSLQRQIFALSLESADISKNFWPPHLKMAERDPDLIVDHSRHVRRLLPRRIPGALSRPLHRCRHCRRPCRHICRRHGCGPKQKSRRLHLCHISAASVRQSSFRMSACRTRRSSLPSTAPSFQGPMAARTTASTISPFSMPCRT